VGTGSHQENASKQNPEPRFDSIETGLWRIEKPARCKTAGFLMGDIPAGAVFLGNRPRTFVSESF
jgi:hypothetical protein